MPVSPPFQLAALAARVLGAIRAAIGVVAIAAPTLAARPWVGEDLAGTPGGRLLARTLGGRDLALGLATLAAPESALSTPIALGALADGVDCAATLLAFGHLPRTWRYLVAASTSGAALAGAAVALELRRAR